MLSILNVCITTYSSLFPNSSSSRCSRHATYLSLISEKSDDVDMSPVRFEEACLDTKPAALTASGHLMPWVRVPAQASKGGYAQHCISHAYMETTWTHCQLKKVLGASSKINDGGIRLKSPHCACFKVIRVPLDHLSYMVNGIGPDTCLWVFVK